MRRCTEIPRNNLWFGERGCLPVWLTNQQPIRFLQLSFPLSVSLPGTGPVRWIHTRIRIQRYILFLKNQNFYFNFCTFFEKSCILPEKIPPEPGIFVCVTIKSNSYARSKSPRRLSFRYNRQSLSHQSPSGTTGPRHLCVRVS